MSVIQILTLCWGKKISTNYLVHAMHNKIYPVTLISFVMLVTTQFHNGMGKMYCHEHMQSQVNMKRNGKRIKMYDGFRTNEIYILIYILQIKAC